MKIEKTIALLDTTFIQEVEDETILLDTLTEEYFTLNESASLFYSVLLEESNLDKAVDILESQIEISRKIIQIDLLQFVNALKDKELINFI